MNKFKIQFRLVFILAAWSGIFVRNPGLEPSTSDSIERFLISVPFLSGTLKMLTCNITLAKQQEMTYKPINPTGSSYSQAVEIKNPSRLVFISGQIPETEDGKVPDNFKDQARLTWKNIAKQLNDAGMSFDNLLKITVYLSDRKYRQANAEIRKEILEEKSPAMTIIIAGIYDENWLLEIEGIAVEQSY